MAILNKTPTAEVIRGDIDIAFFKANPHRTAYVRAPLLNEMDFLLCRDNLCEHEETGETSVSDDFAAYISAGCDGDVPVVLVYNYGGDSCSRDLITVDRNIKIDCVPESLVVDTLSDMHGSDLCPLEESIGWYAVNVRARLETNALNYLVTPDAATDLK